MHTYPPAHECTREQLLDICANVQRDPNASWDLVGSRAHVEAICRLALDHEHARASEHAQAERNANHLRIELYDARDAIDRLQRERDRCADAAVSNAGDLLFALSSRAYVERELEIYRRSLGRERRSRQRLILIATGIRAQRDDGYDRIAQLETWLDEERQHRQCDVIELDRLRQDIRIAQQMIAGLTGAGEIQGALERVCTIITGASAAEVDAHLDAQMAAHPDAGVCHPARDQRERDDDDLADLRVEVDYQRVRIAELEQRLRAANDQAESDFAAAMAAGRERDEAERRLREREDQIVAALMAAGIQQAADLSFPECREPDTVV